MRRYLLCLLAVAGMAGAAFAQGKIMKAKLSPLTQQYLLRAKTNDGAPVPNYVYKHANGKLYISAIIKVSTPEQSAFDALGVKVGTRAGNIWTVQIPVENVQSFTGLAGIEYIQLDEPVRPLLDLARKVTHVDSATSGINMPMPITGKGVIVGIIDAGFDFTHPTMYDTLYQNYRIKKVWLQKSAGTPPTGFIYGNELSDSASITAQGSDTGVLSHGSHVAGIAAGSGYGGVNTNNNNQNNTRFRGMAFESEMVMVGIMPASSEWIATGESDIIDGMNYIYTYGASVSKPVVINLSWGATLGPHDGNSLFSQACDNLTGAGKIFVCAAGNNGADTLHLQKVFTPTDTVVSTFVTFSPYLAGAKKTWVDMWADTAKNFCVNVKLYNGNTEGDSTGFICIDNNTHDTYLIGSNGDTCFVTLTTSSSEFNGRPRVFLSLYSKVPDNICLRVKSTDANVHIWEGYVVPPEGYYGYLRALGYPWAVNGNSDYTVSDIACTRSAVTVAAFTSKVTFKNIDGATLQYSGESVSHIASFSSHGPTQDGRIKPDIAAPGMALSSSINSFDTTYSATGTNHSGTICAFTSPLNGRTYNYAMLAGTSMASPAAAGIVALLLEVAPNMQPSQVKDILAATAIVDNYTGAIPAQGTVIWGHGKINAYQAVLLALQTENVQVVKNQLNCILYPNPNTGSFTINYAGGTAQTLQIQAYDITGRMVHMEDWPVNSNYSSKQLNLSNLAKGTYLINITGSAGSSVIKTVIE